MKKPTLRRRHDDATDQAQRAMSLFASAAQQLDAAAQSHHEVAAEASEQITDLSALRDAADAQAAEALSQARTVRQTFGL